MTSSNHYALLACSIISMAGFTCLAETAVSGPAVMTRPAPLPQVAVTPDMLTELRSETRRDGASWSLAPGAKIPNLTNLSDAERELALRTMAESIKEDGNSDQESAIIAVRRAFPTVSLCRELAWYPPGSDAPRFPFAIEANERLVDALDKLKQNSNGFVDWMLLHQRIVICTQSPAVKGEQYVMERTVQVDIQADTLLEALDKVEGAYNDQYPDAPPIVVTLLSFPTALFEGAPGPEGKSGKLSLKTADSLREIVLTVLDQMQDPALRYHMTEMMMDRERFFQLTIRRFDEESNNRMSAPEASALAQSAEARLYENLRLRVERAGKPAADSGVVKDKP